MIGNPPFLGDKLLIRHLGNDYVARLRKTYSGRLPAPQTSLHQTDIGSVEPRVQSQFFLRESLLATDMP